MNRRNLLWLAAGMAALTAIGSYTAKPLWAQIRAAVVENVDEPGRNPYHETFSFTGIASCTFGCGTISPVKVPTGKRLVVTNVTGVISLTVPGVFAGLRLSDAASNNPQSSILIPSLPPVAAFGSNAIGFNAPVLAYFDQGNQPAISLNTDTGFSSAGVLGREITLSGYYVNLP